MSKVTNSNVTKEYGTKNDIVSLMVNKFNIIKVDFMGYSINKSELSYHHLIVPTSKGGIKTIENGAILSHNTSHPYLHLIEQTDYEIFFRITREMIKQNRLGRLDLECLKNIYAFLNEYEKKYGKKIKPDGSRLIKVEFTKRPIHSFKNFSLVA